MSTKNQGKEIAKTMPPPKSIIAKGRRMHDLLKQGEIRTAQGPIALQHLHVLRRNEPELFMLRQHMQGYPPGTIFIPNRQREKETGNTHMAYPHGLCSALRGMIYALDQLGAVHPDYGERHILQSDRMELQKIAELLKHSVLSDAGLQRTLGRIASGLARSKNDEKKKAQQNIRRGSRTTDVRGRRNPSAASMARGGAMQRLENRERGILAIAKVYKRYARALAEAIDERHSLRNDRWSVFNRGLELDVILRLGLIMRRLERKAQEEYKRETGGLYLAPEHITFRLADNRQGFTEVIRVLKELTTRLPAPLPGDARKVAAIIQAVRIRLRAALTHAKHDQWGMAKMVLKEAAALTR